MHVAVMASHLFLFDGMKMAYLEVCTDREGNSQ
jgi:hypothetical protein